jgi:alpha-tubulin suppressor-like RCC1 family protein
MLWKKLKSKDFVVFHLGKIKMKKGEMFRVGVIILLVIILVFTILNYFSLTGNVIYDATLINISEANLTSTSGIAHLNLTDGGLVLYFAMDDNNTLSKVYDYTNSSNDGDLISSSTYISNGIIGGAYNFSGENYINVSDSTSLDIIGDVSLSAWVNLESLTIFSSVSSGGAHNCGNLSSGEVVCWGQNSNGQLGDGTITNRFVSVPVLGDYSFSQISMGSGSQSCGILQNGTVLCWGKNGDGQLGNGSVGDSSVPIFVAGEHNFSSIFAGTHTCGILQNGTALCWGDNGNGEIGDGTTGTDRVFPTSQLGNYNFTQISLGDGHTCGILVNGSTFCWGYNSYGQLGDGTTTQRTSPVLVLGGNSFISIYAGGYHNCGILQNGTALCWGRNNFGELGNGSIGNSNTPIFVSGTYNFSQISGGSLHNCGILQNGTALCWGRNSQGQLGDGTTTQREAPTLIIGNHNFSNVNSGSNHGCGILQNGTALCWGWNTAGILGDGTTTQRNVPTEILRGMLIGKSGDSYALTSTFNGEIKGLIENSNVTSNTSLSAGWNYIAVSYDATVNKNLYINGALAGTAANSGTYSANNFPLTIMQNTPGSIDEVMVFNKALTTAEVQNIYNNQSSRFYSTGEMVFTQVFGSNNRVNVSIDNCTTLNSTILKAKTSSGSFISFTDCNLIDYTVAGDDVTIQFNSDSNGFFTPLVFGNVIISPWIYTAPAEAETQQSGGGTSIQSSTPAETIIVLDALSVDFWEETTVILEDTWEIIEEPVLADEVITEDEAIIVEQELLDAIAEGQEVVIEEIVIKQISEILGTGERVKFDVKDNESYVGVANVTNDSVVVQVTVGSSSTQRRVSVGSSESFDLNNDSLNDIKVTVEFIDAEQKASIVIAVVYQGIAVVNESFEEEQTAKEKSRQFLGFAAIVMVLLVVIFLFLRFRKFQK